MTRPLLTLFAWILLCACGQGGAETPLQEQVESTQEAIAIKGTFFYFQCNSTGWTTNAATLMTSTSTPGVFTLTYKVSITYNDNCDLVQTPQLNGYGSFQNYFGFTKAQTLITVPATSTLTQLGSGTDNHFNVKYPGTGTFTATFNANNLTLTIAAGSGGGGTSGTTGSSGGSGGSGSTGSTGSSGNTGSTGSTGSSGTTSGSSGTGGGGSLSTLSRVLLLSVDGLHASDLYNWVAASPRSAIAGLYATGVEYADATATTPSNGFPAMLALATGGSPLSTGVFYDDSYDRTLFPPGSQCQGTPGTEVIYTSLLDMDETQPLTTINTAALPLALNPTTSACTPVLPHQFLQTNTIFEVVRGATNSGIETAWADSHPSYEILNGPSGAGVADLFTPEVNSKIANGGTVINASLTACDGVTNSTQSPTDYTTCVPAAMAYDDAKVQAVINEIDGLRSNGTTPAAVPALFGMNFEAVGVAQTLKVAGYADALADPTAQITAAMAHVDASVGLIVAELNKKALTNSTLIVLTAKHGQAPIDASLVNTLSFSRTNSALESPELLVQQTVPTVDTEFASFVNPNTQFTNVSVGGHLQTGGDVGLLWLQTADENNFNISTIVGTLSDPTNATLIGATTPPPGSIFLTSVTSGAELAAVYGDPQSSDALAAARAPDMFVQPDLGNLYINNSQLASAHGGGSFDDTNVPIVISYPTIAQQSVFTPVQTTQVAATILHALRIDPTKLQAVGIEGTTVLPNLPF